nr:MAG TPA: hypothetical protein [Caudoviricetes sp.]
MLKISACLRMYSLVRVPALFKVSKALPVEYLSEDCYPKIISSETLLEIFAENNLICAD